MIKVIEEMELRDFETWSGATDTMNHLTVDEIDQIGSLLGEEFMEGTTATVFNDFLWFERDTIASWLGYNDFDEIIER